MQEEERKWMMENKVHRSSAKNSIKSNKREKERERES